MSDLVVCGECGTRYGSDQNAFCPRCGSTAKGQLLPAALQVARRTDPGRRRVQASGALLLVIGVLFLLSSLVGLAVPLREVAKSFIQPMADQPGGELTLVPDAGHAPFSATVRTIDGELVATVDNATDPRTIPLGEHAAVKLDVTGNGTTVTLHAVVIEGDELTLAVDHLKDGDVAVSHTLATTVSVGRVVFILVAAVLIGGGLCAILLRAWGLAAAAAITGILLAALALVGFLLAGLLFAVPFGFAAAFILRGRRHFLKKGE